MKKLFAVLLLVCAGVAPARAQQDAARPALRLSVTDAQQLAIPGATCTLIAAGAPSGDTVVADEHGSCAFAAVQPGIYVVRVELDGFEPFSRANLTLAAEPVDLPVVLTVARMTQTV